MPDAMDAVQGLVQRETDSITSAQRQAQRVGRTHCKRHDCGEPIAPERTKLGADLCMDCQRERDTNAARFAGGGRR